MVLVIVPMVIFPNQFGTGLARASLVNAFVELVFYGIVLFVLNRRTTLINLVQAAGLCLVYRLAMGGLFGLVIAAMYSMNVRISITMGVSSYLPVILLQILATPFVLKPLLLQSLSLRKAVPDSAGEPVEESSASPTAIAETSITPLTPAEVEPAPVVEPVSVAPMPDFSTPEKDDSPESKTPTKGWQEINGFDRATRYIGEDASVTLAAVIDNDGLLLSHFQRGDVDPEQWAPLALLMRTSQTAVLSRFGWGEPLGISLDLPGQHVVVSYDERFALIVAADQQGSGTLNIRINQALETVRQYLSQRYEERVFENLEINHV
jgi:predicted regulator of Ras-like GTPase activity (Roadblock/LC7/MglB family)